MKTVKFICGRFQPFTLGHLNMIKGRDDIIIFVVRTGKVPDVRHPFSDDLLDKEYNILKKEYSFIKDIIYIKRASITDMGAELVKRGLQASEWITGSDRAAAYEGQVRKCHEYEKTYPECAGAFTDDFKLTAIPRDDNNIISATLVRAAIKKSDKKTYTEMMPEGTSILFNDFKKELDRINESYVIPLSEYISINETKDGGHAFGSPVPARLALTVYSDAAVKITEKYPHIEMAPLGSIGKKRDTDFNGDIDIAVNADMDTIKEIREKVFKDCPYRVNPTLVSVEYEYAPGKKCQIDLMSVRNINWAKCYWWSPDFKKGESKYKGAVRTAMLATAVSEVPTGDAEEYFDDKTTVRRKTKYTLNSNGLWKQVLDWTGKRGNVLAHPKKIKDLEEFVTDSPDVLVKFLFGDAGKMSDITSAESIWKAVHDDKKWKWPDRIRSFEDRFYKEFVEGDKRYIYNINPDDFPIK